MKTKFLTLAFSLMALVSADVFSEPTSGDVTISYLRSYAGNNVYLAITTNAICDMSVFTIDLSTAGGKGMYAAALTAIASNKKVALEISNATGCKGWGTQLQSLYIKN